MASHMVAQSEPEPEQRLSHNEHEPLLKPLTRSWSVRQHEKLDRQSQLRAVPANIYAAALQEYVNGVIASCGCSSLESFTGFLSFFKSARIKTRVGQCLLMNGIIFLGSLLWLHSVMVPLLDSMLTWTSTNDVFTVTLFEQLYNLLWVYPMYITTLCLVSPRLFKDIAQSAFETSIQTQMNRVTSSDSPVSSWPQTPRAQPRAGSNSSSSDVWSAVDAAVRFSSDTVHYLAIVGFFYLQSFAFVAGGALYLPSILLRVLGFILGQPCEFVGMYNLAHQKSLIGFAVHCVARAALFLLYCWLYALYCFEYKWSLRKWPLQRQLRYIEEHWAFFAGFGTPAAAISILFSPCVGLGFYSTLFPLLLLSAEIANFSERCDQAEQQAIESKRALKPASLPPLRLFWTAEVAAAKTLESPRKSIFMLVMTLVFLCAGNAYVG